MGPTQHQISLHISASVVHCEDTWTLISQCTEQNDMHKGELQAVDDTRHYWTKIRVIIIPQTPGPS